jgi:hypothetical protein
MRPAADAMIFPSCPPLVASRRPGRSTSRRPCFIVRDANGQALAYVYFEDEPGRRSAAHMLSRPRIAANMRQAAVLSKEGVR